MSDTPTPTPAVVFETVSIVFGDQPQSALPAMDRGLTRAEVQAETGQVLGVHDCDLTVGTGEIVVLMGLSGSGKSTLIRAVNALNPVARGRVLIDGGEGMEDVTNADARTLRRLRRTRVAMVFQQFGLLPWRNVLDNVALGLELAGLPRRERMERARAQLSLVGLDGWAERMVGELSGGMQQRVGLARAFAGEAPILLMDEPFSALDPLIRREMQDEFIRLRALLGKTIVFVTHDFDEALRLADRIAIMRDGVVEQCDTPDRIVMAPATDYVTRFTEDVEKARVVHAASMARPLNGAAPEGTPVPGSATILEIGRQLAGDTRAEVPVAGPDGAIIGTLDRARALDLLFGVAR
ncbi:MAG: ATP-binding cassette domain-containing protein [Pseudomonadota bacterium]